MYSYKQTNTFLTNDIDYRNEINLILMVDNFKTNNFKRSNLDTIS